MSSQQNLSIARNMYKFFNERKFEQGAEFISENAVIHNIPQNIKMYGKDGFLQFMNFWATAFPDAKVEIKNQVASDEFVVTEFSGKGVHNGILETPMGKINPTGKSIDIPFCEVVHFIIGKIDSSNLYFDVVTMMQQLELSPEKV